MASQIAQAGVDRERIQFEIMNSFSEQRMRLMGEMLLNRMKMFKDLKAASMVLDKAVKDSFDYRDGDSEGFVNLPLKIKDVEISALSSQVNTNNDYSLSSKPYNDLLNFGSIRKQFIGTWISRNPVNDSEPAPLPIKKVLPWSAFTVDFLIINSRPFRGGGR